MADEKKIIKMEAVIGAIFQGKMVDSLNFVGASKSMSLYATNNLNRTNQFLVVVFCGCREITQK